MKCMVRKCCFHLVLVSALLLVAAVQLSSQQTPAPTPSPATSSATPENPKTVNEKLAQLDQRVTAAQSSADNAWMLVSAALVLMMTGPGLALFYGGVGRGQNTLC